MGLQDLGIHDGFGDRSRGLSASEFFGKGPLEGVTKTYSPILSTANLFVENTKTICIGKNHDRI